MHKVLKIVSLLNRAIGTPLAYEANKLLRQGAYDNLVRLEPKSPSDYARAYSYMCDAQVVAFVKKLRGLPTTTDLHLKAVEVYNECESQNRLTNDRLAYYVNWFERGFVGDVVDERLYDFLIGVRKRIADVLGPLPRFLVPSFSGGSTFFDKGDKITIPHKVGSRLSATSRSWDTTNGFLYETAWGKAHKMRWNPKLVRGNRFTSVPKDSKKNRGICIEPTLNITFQLPLGGHIRRRISECIGIHIDGKGSRNAQSVHRALARAGSLSGQLATIDLSNASDLVSYMLVKLLLPRGWFDLLNDLRSPETIVEGEWRKNHKFSSMGNGFTFELETLIFWAICRSVVGGDGVKTVSAYGDDMIIPARQAGDCMAALKLFGLTVNESKSFVDPLDPFRESCGGDFFQGVPVRPVYLKNIPSQPHEWMSMHNQIAQLLHRGFNDNLVHEAMDICVGCVPKTYRLFGPEGLDTVFRSSNEATRRWKSREKRDSLGNPCAYHELKQLRIKHKKINLGKFRSEIQLASALLRVSSEGPTARDGISGFSVVWRPTVMSGRDLRTGG